MAALACEDTNSDETFMLVRSSKAFDALKEKLLAPDWQQSLLQVVTSTRSDVVMFGALVVFTPVLLIMVFCIAYRVASVSDMKEKPPEVTKPKTDPLSSAIPASTSVIAPQRYVCPELAVPSGLDCEFAIPHVRSDFMKKQAVKNPRDRQVLNHDILDRKGQPLLKLVLSRVDGQSQSSFFEQIRLAKPDETECATCELDVLCDGGRVRSHCSILVPSGESFGRLDETQGGPHERCFTISSAHAQEPWCLRVAGDFTTHQGVNVFCAQTGRRIAAITEPTAEASKDHYLLRIASCSDAALIMISLVVIDRIVALVDQTVISSRSLTSSHASH